MPTPVIHRHRTEFDDRNLFLQLALGVVSASRRLDRVLDRYGRRAAPGGSAAASTGDDQVLYFVLGVLAFRQRAVAILEDARLKKSPQRAPQPSGEADRQGAELRDLLR